ncbi:MAG: hypothetical protein M1839_000485 [Geoglossum umbratile]|nr:MAG: hypothetical protein M1839_000485 [Geoglossum umbratile]
MANIYDAQLDAFSIYHKLQEECEEAPSSTPTNPALPALGHALAGSIGTALSNTAVFPLDLIITRLQVQRLVSGKPGFSASDSDEYRNIPDAAYKIYTREGGIGAFYTGVAQDTAKSIADSFLFFLAYNFLRRRRLRSRTAVKGRPARALPILDELAVGMVAGAFSKLFTTPISNIVTRKQITSMLASRAHCEDEPSRKPAGATVASIAHDIYTTKGLKGFWSGYSATLVLTLNPSLTFLFYNTLKRVLLRRPVPGARATFLLAAISKALASTITYPFSLAKARSQATGTHHTGSLPRPKTVFGSLWAITQTQGLSALYEGVSGEVTKGFLSNGTTMMLKQIIHHFIVQAYYITLDLSHKYATYQMLERAGSVVKNGAKGGLEKLSEGARDALMDLGDEVEEVAYAMGEDANDVFWGMVDTTGELGRDVVEILGGKKGEKK